MVEKLREPKIVIPDSECEPTDYVVNALIFNADGQIILLKRPENHKYYPGYWGPVMGKVNPNEFWLDALSREVEEEIGVRTAERDILYYGPDIFKEWNQNRYLIKTYFVNIGSTKINLNH